MVVKFDNHHWRLNTIVEGVFGAKASDPAEVGFVGKGHCVCEFLCAGGGGEVEEVFFDDV